MLCEFAIVPDDDRRVAAVFVDLSDALEWGTARYGEDRFTVRHCPVLEVLRDEAPAARRMA
jgi:hypothetical protein